METENNEEKHVAGPLSAPPFSPLPCPFCGGVPVVGPSDPKINGNAWGFVSCRNLDCPAQPTVQDGEVIADERGSAAYIALAVNRWNRRANAKAQAPAL